MSDEAVPFPAAEANGMIIEIGKFVLREACRNAHGWRQSLENLSLRVNLSARQFQRSDLVHEIILVGRADNLTELEALVSARS